MQRRRRSRPADNPAPQDADQNRAAKEESIEEPEMNMPLIQRRSGGQEEEPSQQYGEEQKSRSGGSIDFGFNRGGIWTDVGSVPERHSAISPPTIPRGASIGGAFAPAQVGLGREGAAPSSSQQSFAASNTQAQAGQGIQGIQGRRTTRDHAGPDRHGAQWFRPVHAPQETPLYNTQQQQLSPPTNAAALSPFLSGRAAPYQHVSPTRFRPASAASSQSIESHESASSQTSSFRKSAASGQIRKRSRRSPSPQMVLESEEDSSEKSPLPQNLRGDPFRSAKVKTELCRNFSTGKGCPFGDKCNYAHGEHELKYTKLMDLESAGLVDIEIFRTRPCPTWVATGSCPFDQRCIGLHDPRVSGTWPSWLPHAETLVNSIGSSLNIDKVHHQQLAAVYSCSPVYGYVPQKKWKTDQASTESAWKHFYAFVCNLDVQESSTSYWHHTSGAVTGQRGAMPPQDRPSTPHQERSSLPEIYRISIALKMREYRVAQCYAYMPTHLLFGELCMVLQTRMFVVNTDNSSGSWNTSISEVAEDVSAPSDAFGIAGKETIIAHEIAFGPVGDPSVRQIAVWFNLSTDNLIPCTAQQAKRHKRSRHRIKKTRQGDGARTPRSTGTPSPKITLPSNTMPGFDSTLTPPFYNYQPVDNAACDLIFDILRHRWHCLDYWNFRPSALNDARQRLQSLEEEEQRLKASFETQRRFWLTWSWPVAGGVYEVDDSTDVPPVEGRYFFELGEDDNFQTEAFFGVDDGRGRDVVSHESQMALYFLWKSFVMNIQLETGKYRRRPKGVSKISLDEEFHRLCRLPIFRYLSMGVEISGNRTLPMLMHEEPEQPSALELFLNEWQTVIEHYDEKNRISPLKKLEVKQDAETVEKAKNTTTMPPENSATKMLNDAAPMMTRMRL